MFLSVKRGVVMNKCFLYILFILFVNSQLRSNGLALCYGNRSTDFCNYCDAHCKSLGGESGEVLLSGLCWCSGDSEKIIAALAAIETEYSS